MSEQGGAWGGAPQLPQRAAPSHPDPRRLLSPVPTCARTYTRGREAGSATPPGPGTDPARGLKAQLVAASGPTWGASVLRVCMFSPLWNEVARHSSTRGTRRLRFRGGGGPAAATCSRIHLCGARRRLLRLQLHGDRHQRGPARPLPFHGRTLDRWSYTNHFVWEVDCSRITSSSKTTEGFSVSPLPRGLPLSFGV